MYAEQFNAPSWLEGPSQWLWWAFQSMQARKLTDAAYNLNQFWASLDKLKVGADVTTWPEILALDSRSHLMAADLQTAFINATLQDANTWSAWLTGPVAKTIHDPKAAVVTMQQLRAAELQKSADLAAQSGTAQSQRQAAVDEGAITEAAKDTASEDTDLASIAKGPSLADFGLTTPVLLAIGAALALVLWLKVKK